MTKKVPFPQALHDFEKGNGSVTLFVTVGPSLTRQEFVEECDINSIMKKYEGHAHGGPNGLGFHPDVVRTYVDFAEAPQTLLEFMTFMNEAQSAFMTLPAAVRKEFDNDAPAFVDFASDPRNLEQMREWGLAPPAKPSEVPPVSPAPAAPAPAGGSAPAPAGAATAAGGPSTHTST